MLLVAASLYCAFGTLRDGGDIRFWISLCIISLIGIAYLVVFLQNEKDYIEMKKKAETPPPPDDNSTVSRFFMNNCPAPAIVCDETGKVLRGRKHKRGHFHRPQPFLLRAERRCEPFPMGALYGGVIHRRKYGGIGQAFHSYVL